MQYSHITALLLACLAAASPTPEVAKGPFHHREGYFKVSKFAFSCLSDCEWSFDVGTRATRKERKERPPVKQDVRCQGIVGMTNSYKPCGFISPTQEISAYVERYTNELYLQYKVAKGDGSETDWYLGNTTVYTSTGPNATKFDPTFKVIQTSHWESRL